MIAAHLGVVAAATALGSAAHTAAGSTGLVTAASAGVSRPGVIALALALCAAMLALDRARRRRARVGELVVRAAHELRGPLAAAHLGLESVSREAGLDRSRFAGVDVQLQRAGLALGDLTAALSGDRIGDRPAPVDIAELLDDQVRAWAPMAAVFGRDVRLAASMPAGTYVVGDRARLAQALGNVVANAVEHGAGTIALSARAGGGQVRIEIADGGDGLPGPVAELVARPRAGRGSRGRGLAIAADVAARHGGRLTAAPSSAGARIVLELPAAGPSDAPFPDDPASGGRAAPFPRRSSSGDGPAPVADARASGGATTFRDSPSPGDGPAPVAS